MREKVSRSGEPSGGEEEEGRRDRLSRPSVQEAGRRADGAARGADLDRMK